MLNSLAIEGFRCFQKFELPQLGRVNLLVGTNNSGKTSILEAVQLFYSWQNPDEILTAIISSRGEYARDTGLAKESNSPGLAIRHLFYGHRTSECIQFSTTAKNEGIRETLKIHVRQPSVEYSHGFALVWDWLGQYQDKGLIFPLSSDGNILGERIPIKGKAKVPEMRTEFVASSSLKPREMVELFEGIVLTPEEDLVIGALKTIEPNLKRIASIGSEGFGYSYPRDGFLVLLSDSEKPIPIGSMGDGIWRMLGLTLSLVNARGGVLLVDAIDTGLHFSIMSDMWRLVVETARRLNVQVFATTHNSDCWTSLADIVDTQKAAESEITIHRIEKGAKQSVVFNEREIAIAAERDIEVR